MLKSSLVVASRRIRFRFDSDLVLAIDFKNFKFSLVLAIDFKNFKFSQTLEPILQLFLRSRDCVIKWINLAFFSYSYSYSIAFVYLLSHQNDLLIASEFKRTFQKISFSFHLISFLHFRSFILFHLFSFPSSFSNFLFLFLRFFKFVFRLVELIIICLYFRHVFLLQTKD